MLRSKVSTRLSSWTRSAGFLTSNPSAIPRRRFFFSSSTSKASEDGSQTHTIEFPESHFVHYNCPPIASTTTVTTDEILKMYKTMVTIRRLETASDQLYKAKLIRGFCHLSIGQEAVATGMESGITAEDAIITAYRCHGFTWTRGQTPTAILAELMGRKDGCSQGKGGSMHMFAKNFYGGNGIVGAQVPIGAGVALAQKYLGQNTMTMALYGDGAANQGQVFEAYNMAKLWHLPVVFVCENNMYGMGTSAHRAAASTKFYTRGDYIPGVRVNAMDVLAVREGCRYARDWAISGKGPLVLEMVTYRYGGHSMSDPGTTYRTREEIQHMRSTNDCIQGLMRIMLERQICAEEDVRKMDKEIRTQIDQAVVEAKKSPEPDNKELWTDIYTKGNEPPFMRGRIPDEIHRY